MTKIDDETEIQFRQVNPCWVQNGEPSRQAFFPMRNDEGKLSMDRSATTDAKSAFDSFKALGLNSDGVYGLMPSEFQENPNPIQCFESPLDNNPHHSHADFNGLSNSQKKAKSQDLLRKAIARGKIHP